MGTNSLPKSAKTLRRRSWFESLAFWPSFRKVTVEAEQTKIHGLVDGLHTGCLAVVTIKQRGKTVFKYKIPWVFPRHKDMLLLQVYTLSQQPDFGYPKWQKVLERFSFMHDGFEPPDEMWWTDEIATL